MNFRRYIWVILIVISGITLTSISAYYTHRVHKTQDTERLARTTSHYFEAISFSLRKNLDHLSALQAYFSSSPLVSRTQFASFSSSLMKESFGIQALEWVPRVPNNKRSDFEQSAQLHGYSDFQFSEKMPNGELGPAQRRDEYYPVYFVEPFIPNIKAFGFDLASNPVRKKALIEARDSGNIVLTRRITLIQERGTQYGILAFQPVYRRDLETKSIPQRKLALKGFVLGVFRIGDIVNSALARLAKLKGVNIQIIDRNAPKDMQLLFEQVGAKSADDTPSPHSIDTGAITYPFELPVQNGDWDIVFTQHHKHFLLGVPGISWFVLVVGLLMTSMITFIVFTYMNRMTMTAMLVEQRTQELRSSEEKAVQIAQHAEQARYEAEIANSAKSNFLSTMSHEIRTPLNGVLGMAQLLKNSGLEEEQGKKVETILSSGRTLLAIINDVLDMSKIEAGGIELEITAFSLRNLISSISTPFQSLASDKGITLSVHKSIKDTDILKGDPVRLRQIIWNLISNAIKFTHTGTVTIEITNAPPLNKKDVSIRIAVQDTGTGISEDRLPHIFSPFTQEDTSITRKFGGSGLGLSIVKSLVELMDGIITVSSKVDEGTRFEVVLPFDIATGEEAAQIHQRSIVLPPDNEYSGLSVLIAEDNTVNALIAEAFLEKFGHTPYVVENGAEAVKAVQKYTFDLILMDIHMPEMDGIEATKTIRSMSVGEHIPIIGLTAEAFAERHILFKQAGMDDVITKPFTEEQLRSALGQFRSLAPHASSETLPLKMEPEPEIIIGNSGELEAFKNLFPPEKIKEILDAVPKTIQVRLEEIRAAIIKEDLGAIKAAAHSIVGVSGSMFAPVLSVLARELETNTENIEQVQKQMPEFEQTVKATIAWWQAESKKVG